MQHWLGAMDVDMMGSFSWSDGSPWDYVNWEANEPNNLATEHCVSMRNTGQWKTKSCADVRPFICPIPPLTPCVDTDSDGRGPGCFYETDCAPTDEDLNDLCGPDVNICDGLLAPGGTAQDEESACHCTMTTGFGDPYLICEQSVDWFKARDICALMGKQLYVALSSFEFNYFSSLLEDFIEDELWIWLCQCLLEQR